MKDTNDGRKGETTPESRRPLTTRRDFFVSLPAALGAVAFLKFAPQPTTANPSRQCRLNWRQSAATVWIVDDDADLGELYELALGLAGYSTRTFQDRIEALQFLRQTNDRPSLLITDFFGRSLSANRFLQDFRTEHPQINVLMVTGCDQSCLQTCVAKPDRFLQKPFDLRVLLREVAAMVQCQNSCPGLHF